MSDVIGNKKNLNTSNADANKIGLNIMMQRLMLCVSKQSQMISPPCERDESNQCVSVRVCLPKALLSVRKQTTMVVLVDRTI